MPMETRLQILKGLILFHIGLLLLAVGFLFGFLALPPPENVVVMLFSIFVGVYLIYKGYKAAKFDEQRKKKP